MSAGDEAIRRQARLEAERARRQADRLEEERARPVPRADRVVAVDRRELQDLFAWLRSGARTQAMSTDAFTAALHIARAAGIEFP